MQAWAIVRLSLAVLGLSAAAQAAQAAVNCTVVNGSAGFTGNMALQINSLVVPRDMPVGTIIYRQNFIQAGAGAQYQCTELIASSTVYYWIDGAGANTGYNDGINVYKGKIYETGVPGIGVAWFAGQSGVGAVGATQNSLLNAEVAAPIRNDCSWAFGVPIGSCRTSQLKFPSTTALVLIKTGPVGIGTISGSALGKMRMFVDVGSSPIMFVGFLGLTGNIQVVGTTCKTPDVNVPLGKQQMSSQKGIGSGKGSYTPTVNFVIALTGCPGFPGYYGNPLANPASSQNAVISAGTRIANTLSLRLDPSIPAIDVINGVLSLSADPESATGVGVQVLSANGDPMPLSRSVPLNTELVANTQSITISLGARYLQTETSMTPGKANAVATYTLNYQ